MTYKSLAIQLASTLHESDRLNAEFNDLILSGMDVTNCWNRIQLVNTKVNQTKNQIFQLNQEELSHEN